MADLPPPPSIREALSYDASSGVFVWLINMNNRAKAGTVAGGINRGGYRRIKFGEISYPASRLAWWFVTGEWPKCLDHINAKRADDRFVNLRKATMSENARNRSSARGSSSQFLGVCLYRKKLWHAQINSGGKVRHLGYFDGEVDAARAYDEAAHRLHGGFARLNFPGELRA